MDEEQYDIDPDERIDCDAREPARRVTANFEASAVPIGWRDFIAINARYSVR